MTCVLSEEAGWVLCQVGSIVVITLGADNFIIEIDSRDRVTTFGGNQYTINGRSHTSKYGEGAEPVYNTWGATTANAVINSLVDTPIVIDTLDWNFAEDALSSDGETPISIISRIAHAVGGIVYTTCDGILRVVPKYKVAPADYVISSTDYSISDLDDIYSISESRTKKPGYNQVEVTDEPGSSMDVVSIEVTDIDTINFTASVRVTVFPFQPTFDLQSSHNGVTIPPSLTEIEEQLTEIVEIVNGVGSIARPLFTLVSYTYIDADMGILSCNGTAVSTLSKGTTLVEIKYITKYHHFIVTATEAEKTQIYTEG
jgi:hypothetical protein